MSEPALEAILRRDRAIVYAALSALTALAWGYTTWLAALMPTGGAAAMSGMRMGASPFSAAMVPATEPWSGLEFAFVFAMWTIMMVGMMVPSAAPTILIYARVGRQTARQGKPLAAAGFFAGGYLFAWTAFSLAATLCQWGLQRGSLLAPGMTMNEGVLGGAVLIAAGLFQWAPLKDACLAHCQAPLTFIQKHGGFRRAPLDAVALGLRHGIYCVGCCWALMALLFVVGIMNVFWIALIAVFVLLEKLLRGNRLLSRGAGVALVSWGAWLLAVALT